MLQDIATLTGGTVTSEEIGMELEKPPRRPRSAKRVVSQSKTIQTPSSSMAWVYCAAIQAALPVIRQQIEEATSDYDREKLQERVYELAGGVAVIKVGAATEVENEREESLRVEDAPARDPCCAVEEGVVAGGGVAPIRVASKIADPERPERRPERVVKLRCAQWKARCVRSC